jgi:GNAT superfamily N-acetyltransferase
MISIKRAQNEDASVIIKVKINAFSEEVALYGSGPPGYDCIEEQIKAIQYGNCCKILDNEKIIGGISAYDKGAGHYRIGSIFVDLNYQNQGIGSLAMQFIQNEFPQVQKWSLDTPYKSFRNHHFYEKLGFIKIGETEPEPERNEFYLFLYEKYNGLT